MEGGVSTPSLVPFVCTQKRRARVKRAREREGRRGREGESERRLGTRTRGQRGRNLCVNENGRTAKAGSHVRRLNSSKRRCNVAGNE